MVHQAMFQPCPKCGRTMNPRAKTCGLCAGKGRKKIPADVVALVCLNCEESFELPRWRVNQGRGSFCSKKCHDQFLTTIRGKDHPKATGRYAPVRYRGSRWEESKATALKRANGRCEKCTIDLIKVSRYAVHHIRGIHTFDNPGDGHTPENLLVICQSCHAKIHNLGKNNV